jgi:hypothetical protein
MRKGISFFLDAIVYALTVHLPLSTIGRKTLDTVQ